MKKIKIAFIASTLDVGGSENVVRNLITRLPGERFESALYILKGAGTIGGELLDEGYRGASGLQHHRADARIMFKLAAHLRSFSADIVLALDHHNAILWGTVSSLLARVPIRVIASHSTGRMNGGRSFNRVDRLALPHVTAVIALSRSHAEYLRSEESVDGSKIVVIENGIDMARYEGVEQEAVEATRGELGLTTAHRVVTMVAALRPEKAHEALLAAAGALGKTHEATRFLIVGEGSRRQALESMARDLGLSGRVLFLGERRDIPELLHLSDVVVLPSHPAVETLPLAVLEAMAAGVPVVASAVGSIPDVIEDGVNGRLIDPADANGLASAIRDIIDKSQLSIQIAQRGKETIRARYTLDRMVSGYQTLFERLAENTAK